MLKHQPMDGIICGPEIGRTSGPCAMQSGALQGDKSWRDAFGGE